jgi:uncharacterized membrane protein
MEKLIVVVFDNQQRAFDGLGILRELDNEGQLSVYEAQVVTKTAGGAIRVIHRDDMAMFPLLAGGTTVGALIGLLGGSIGVLVGATAGAVVGSIEAVKETEATDDFVHDASTAMTPGKVALVADIVEEWGTPLDRRMEELGGVVFRQARAVVKITRQHRDAAAHKAETAQLKTQRQLTTANLRARIDARVDHLLRKLESAVERKRAQIQARQHQWEARINALQTQANRVERENRQRQEDRIAALRSEYAEKTGHD